MKQRDISVLPLFISIILIAVGLVSAETAVPLDSPLVPTGLTSGDSFQLIFLTSAKTNRDSGDGSDNFTIDHWDDFVNGVADNSTLAEIKNIVWYAMVSVDNLSDELPGIAARDHAVVSTAVYRIDGEQIATGFADIWDGNIAVNINIDESGNLVNTSGSYGVNRETWTGSTWAGEIHGAYPLGNGNQSAVTGSAEATGTGWFQNGNHMRRATDNTRRMYALSEVITVSSILPPTVDAGNDMISWSGASFELDPNVINNNPQTGLVFTWTGDPVDGVTAEFSAADVQTPIVTLTKDAPTGDVTAVILRLAVNNEGSDLSDIVDTLIVDLYDDACKAAAGSGQVLIDPGDFNEDCKTNLLDFAMLSERWLDNYEITEPQTK